MRYVCLFILVFIFAFPAVCGSVTSTVSGELATDTPIEFTSLEIELQQAQNQAAPPERTHVSADGRFDFRGISEGLYFLYVRTELGETLHREVVQIQTLDKRLYVRLHTPKQDRPTSGVVSLNQLLHKPPKNAVKAFKKSVALAQKGDEAGAVLMLEKAIELDPEYMQAINNLGVRHLVAGRVDQAIEKFERAIVIDRSAPASYSNLAHALIMKFDFAAAENASRRALALNQGEAKPSYLLGLSLVMQDKFTPEAIACLRRSDHISPRARLTLGYALAKTGSIDAAKETLQLCLQSPDGPVRAEAQRLLSGIR
ncbi:MAG TPA: tetratricopeptide repeat protein [Bryobacteraceae bacterium]|nr:tetratricopeptide repeat protein [Bryobacteraceae bacterium]